MKCTLHSELVREVLFTERIYAFLHNPTNGLSLPLSPVKRHVEKFLTVLLDTRLSPCSW